MNKKILVIAVLLALVISGCATYDQGSNSAYESMASSGHSGGCH